MDTCKSKDGLKAQKDMVQLNMMPQLHPVPEANGKYTLPAACFNLTPEEKRAICTFLRGVKVPKRTCPKTYCHRNEKVSRGKSLQWAS